MRDSIDKKYNLMFVDDVGNGEQLVDSYFKYTPDVIIVDIGMPVMGGFEAVEVIKSRDENVKALFLSMDNDDYNFYKSIKAGGRGLIGKNFSPEHLVCAIREVHQGGFFHNKVIDNNYIAQIAAQFDMYYYNNPAVKMKEMYKSLSPREKEFLSLLTEGLTREKTAERMNVSKFTYDKYEKSIKTKLNLETTQQLQKFAYEYKFLK